MSIISVISFFVKFISTFISALTFPAPNIGVNNEITLGNSNVTALRCQVTSITSLSDKRDKTNIEDSKVLEPNETYLFSTGFSIFIGNPDYAAFILPRSGLGHKNGIVLGNLIGLIDSDYQGEIMISLWNRSKNSFTINRGDRIAQMMFIEVVSPVFKIVDRFDETERGAKGFGSSGKD